MAGQHGRDREDMPRGASPFEGTNPPAGRHINPIEVERWLGGVDYPMRKDRLMDSVREQGAGDDVLDIVRRMPDRQYDSPEDIAGEVERVQQGGA